MVRFPIMNDTTPEKKSAVTKSLAIAGLIGIIILISWLAIQLVSVLPTALSSLASLADSVYNYDPKKENTLTLNTENDTINSGESTNLTWSKLRESDSFAFSYKCEDGVSVNLKTDKKELSSLTCGNTYDIGSVEKVELFIDSEEKRISELTFNIDTFRKNSPTSTDTVSKMITVVNPSISNIAVNVPDSDTTSTEDTMTDSTENNTDSDTETNNDNTSTDEKSEPETEDTDAENTVTETQEETEDETPTYTPPQSDPIVFSQPEYTYEIPTSNPNGVADLMLSNLKVGALGFTSFIETENIINSVEGGVQFTVHNIGNKTSEEWTYTAILPGNINYKSEEQTPLKPNERATITIGFPTIVNDDELQKISATIATDDDRNYANNQLEKTLVVVE